MEVILLIILFVLGACLGSFLCCQARRFHHRLQKGSKDRSSKTAKATSPKSKSINSKFPRKLPSRSICLHCGRQLKWYDNIPIISWLSLHGRCRFCHQKIGAAELFSEILTGLAWLSLGATFLSRFTLVTPLEIAIFVATLLLTLPLIFLAIYDGLYGELPVLALTISIICAIIVLTLRTWASISVAGFSYSQIADPLSSVTILGGLYLILYLLSKGKWVGDGDWILATAIGLALADPWLALIALFLTNFLACVYALPHRQKHPKIHLGPFLVAAFIIVLTFADFLQTMV